MPAHILLLFIVGLSIVLMLVRPRGIAEVWWVSGGALLLILLRLEPLTRAGHAAARGSDVYLFLTGMMLLSELAREQGVFDWVASVAVRGARGSCSRLFLMVYSVGTLVTVFLSNDATAVVLTPAVAAAVRAARVRVPDDARRRDRRPHASLRVRTARAGSVAACVHARRP